MLLTKCLFCGYHNSAMSERGRPPKEPDERKTASVKIPLTEEEKGVIQRAAEVDGTKPVTWAREVLLRVAKRKAK